VCQKGGDGGARRAGVQKHAAIIGAGVIGCSIALELRRRGFAVSVIDRNGLRLLARAGLLLPQGL
jgi:glycine/D-amino acid oxidase-like deaminating enzyme